MTNKKAILLSLLSFGFLALAMPPWPLGPGALVFLAPWFYVLRVASKKTALLSSYLGAFLFNAISIYWLYHVGDVAPPSLILSGLFLGISYLSLYTMLCAYIFVRIRDVRFKKLQLLWLFPFFWAGAEVLQAKGDLSFPWLSLGLVFGNSLEMMQSFALFGVFGVSIIIIASNMCLAEAILHNKKKLIFVPLVIAALIYAGGFAAINIEENSKKEIVQDTLVIAVVQPSVHQTKKWSRDYFDTVMSQTWELFRAFDPSNVNLIVFPETAIPDFINARQNEAAYLHDYAAENNTVIVTGVLNRTRNEKRKKNLDIYNSAFLFGSGYPAPEYRKTHLVPFSERVPFDNIFPIVNYVDLGGGGAFVPGDSLSIWQPGNFSPLICYEAIYGSILRNAKRKGAKFIANITNDGWFYKSTAPYQHFNLVRAHAVENGIGIVRAANTGISAFIKANGKIIEKTELFEKKIIVNSMPIETRFTPYSVLGDYIEAILFMFFLLQVLILLLLPIIRKIQNKIYKNGR
ncbi:MAG: apolipoprotein N-acyltransferase [Fibromonadaceae bacterium]|jgi:apolipoprotein N-acyltransferase|nr:apolipoprotein N-acyltransferase [Fibromonadaceae bacterium]